MNRWAIFVRMLRGLRAGLGFFLDGRPLPGHLTAQIEITYQLSINERGDHSDLAVRRIKHENQFAVFPASRRDR